MVGKDYPSYLASRPELVVAGGQFFPVSNRQALLEAQGAEVKQYYGALGSEMGASISTGLASTIGGALEGLTSGILTGKAAAPIGDGTLTGDGSKAVGFLQSGLGMIALIVGGFWILGKYLGRKR